MQYEMKSWVPAGSVVNNNNGTYTQQINVTSNIVGNTYPEFFRQDTTSFNFLTTDTIEQASVKGQTAAVAFTAKKYPNT